MYLEASTCASDTERKCRAAPYVGVVTLTKQLYDTRYLCGVLEQHERQRDDRRSADVVRGIRDRNVQQLANRVVVGRPCVCECQREDTAVPQDSRPPVAALSRCQPSPTTTQ